MLYDFHIHSCLSPCGDDLMTPNNIAGMAFVAGLGIISLTDHNSCKNLPAMAKCCEKYKIKFIPGVEASSAEDFHITCYFDNLKSSKEFDKILSESMPPIINRPEFFGRQLVMDENDNFTDTEEKLLLNAGTLTAKQLVDLCHSLGGIAVYAHIDAQSYSVISVLGALPPEIDIDGVEFEKKESREHFINCGLIKSTLPYMFNSDAHYLEDIGKKENVFSASNPLYKMAKKMFGEF
jgi:PHP family Zn ribbon phosphoesterase